MVTSGMDKKLKVFDIRAFKPLKSYFLPAGASCLSLSQRGLLAAATGDIVQVIVTNTWSVYFYFIYLFSEIYPFENYVVQFNLERKLAMFNYVRIIGMSN